MTASDRAEESIEKSTLVEAESLLESIENKKTFTDEEFAELQNMSNKLEAVTVQNSGELMEIIDFIWDVTALRVTTLATVDRKSKEWAIEVSDNLQLLLSRLLTLTTQEIKNTSEKDELKRIVSLIQEVKKTANPDTEEAKKIAEEGLLNQEAIKNGADKLNATVKEWLQVKDGKRKLDVVLGDEDDVNRNELLNKVRSSINTHTPQELLGELLTKYYREVKNAAYPGTDDLINNIKIKKEQLEKKIATQQAQIATNQKQPDIADSTSPQTTVVLSNDMKSGIGPYLKSASLPDEFIKPIQDNEIILDQYARELFINADKHQNDTPLLKAVAVLHLIVSNPEFFKPDSNSANLDTSVKIATERRNMAMKILSHREIGEPIGRLKYAKDPQNKSTVLDDIVRSNLRDIDNTITNAARKQAIPTSSIQQAMGETLATPSKSGPTTLQSETQTQAAKDAIKIKPSEQQPTLMNEEVKSIPQPETDFSQKIKAIYDFVGDLSRMYKQEKEKEAKSHSDSIKDLQDACTSIKNSNNKPQQQYIEMVEALEKAYLNERKQFYKQPILGLFRKKEVFENRLRQSKDKKSFVYPRLLAEHLNSIYKKDEGLFNKPRASTFSGHETCKNCINQLYTVGLENIQSQQKKM